MKGHRKFLSQEAISIRRILAELRFADRNTQKRLREMLRKNYKFYISDFDRSRKGFTAADFDCLIESGEIEIEG